jgi:hypothetical protein
MRVTRLVRIVLEIGFEAVDRENVRFASARRRRISNDQVSYVTRRAPATSSTSTAAAPAVTIRSSRSAVRFPSTQPTPTLPDLTWSRTRTTIVHLDLRCSSGRQAPVTVTPALIGDRAGSNIGGKGCHVFTRRVWQQAPPAPVLDEFNQVGTRHTSARRHEHASQIMSISSNIAVVAPLKIELWMRRRLSRPVYELEPDAVQCSDDKCGTWPAAEPRERLIHGTRLVGEDRHGRARITDHRLEKQYVVADIVQSPQRDHRAVEMVQKSEAVNDVESAEWRQIVRLNVHDMSRNARTSLTEDGDVFGSPFDCDN